MQDPKLFAVTCPEMLQNGLPESEAFVDAEGVLRYGINPETKQADAAYFPMSAEESIVFMARVSSPNQRTESAAKLLAFLVRHGHWSPFDMVDMIIEIHTSRAIMAQILRHWSFRFQEFSQRYSAVPEQTNWDHVETRFIADGGNRQGSSEIGPAPMGLSSEAQESCRISEAKYQWLIKRDIAPESARMIMPLATPTRAYMKGSVRSWMTYFWQRLDSHAQKEHRELAFKMFAIFKEQFPVIGELVENWKPQVVEGEWI